MAAITPSIHKLLPVELMEHIISLVDEDSPPPTTHLLHEPPSVSLFKGMPDAFRWTDMSLKGLSETCRTLRSLVVPRLFAHLKVAGEHAQNLVDFRKSSSLHVSPKSILLYLNPDEYPSVELNDADINNMRSLRARATWMVDVVNPQALTILAPPSCLGWLVDHPLQMSHCWVTNVPYQMIRLEQGPLAPSQWFPRDEVHNNHTLSTVRPWNHCTYNEGSFVPAYSTYDYHIYEAPSLHQSASLSEIHCHALQLGCLRSFELVAVFPFNHMRTTIYFLDLLPNLKSLSVQLAPSLQCQKQNVVGSSASSPSDFWMEIETSYNLLRDALNHALIHLSTYTIMDYVSPGYRSVIDLAMTDISQDWKPSHDGTWIRKVGSSFHNMVPTRNKKPICPGMEHFE